MTNWHDAISPMLIKSWSISTRRLLETSISTVWLIYGIIFTNNLLCCSSIWCSLLWPCSNTMNRISSRLKDSKIFDEWCRVSVWPRWVISWNSLSHSDRNTLGKVRDSSMTSKISSLPSPLNQWWPSSTSEKALASIDAKLPSRSTRNRPWEK